MKKLGTEGVDLRTIPGRVAATVLDQRPTIDFAPLPP
jgi:hypothetical protein